MKTIKNKLVFIPLLVTVLLIIIGIAVLILGQPNEIKIYTGNDFIRFVERDANKTEKKAVLYADIKLTDSYEMTSLACTFDGIDYSDKSTFCWISVIRLPDFITKKDFDWAVETAAKKKKLDCSKAEFLTIDEGLCVQIMHSGPFENEPETVEIMNRYITENGYENDFSDTRIHHEIYLSDARKVAPEKWKTVIRHPIKRKGN